MAQNVFFNNFANSGEQKLIEDLTIESIGIYGVEAYYLNKTYGDYDYLYGEDDLGTFSDYYTVPMYINSAEGFGGEGDFLSKFGVEQRDTMTMSVARWTFEQEVGNETKANISRPREGDVIYFPLNKKLYTINFVEHEPVFYQMGALQFYELRLEMFEYSGERLNTGLYEIDKLETRRSMDTFLKSQLVMETGDPELPIHIESGQRILLSGYTETDQDDITDSENDFFETTADGFLDFSDGDPFSEGGTF
tara:strand:- start:21 stop:770 length:750 start_codon:yes stop_codon:yes gene_type:complete